MSEIFFTADTHFGHKRILDIGHGRPWDTIEEHDAALIENWNTVVRRGDRVYFNGDFSFHRTEQTLDILNNLHGTIYWIRGNHDPKENPNPHKVAWMRDMFDLKVDHEVHGEKQRQLIVLCHYPLLTWNRGHYGSWMLHGHSHGNLSDSGTNTRIDVGVDSWDYTPVSFDQIREAMRTRSFEPVDHHE